MSLFKKHPLDLPTAVIAGGAAGIVSGLVKLGWENVLPPRTAERDTTNPPQTLLEQFGVPAKVTHATYTYSGHKLPWVSYVIHFGFSTTFAVLYQIVGEKLPLIKKDAGTWFGLTIWIAFHVGLMPAMGTVPAAKDQPTEEHVSEALGHIAWMVTNDLVGAEVYRRLVAEKRK